MEPLAVRQLKPADLPPYLRNSASPPKQLFVCGEQLEESLARPRVAIVGSRKLSTYGRSVTAQLAGALARQGIVIVSGLALGVDAVAHRAALEHNGITLAVLPCGLDKIYPATHAPLARDILAQGGALISEYPAGTPAFKQHFIARNRIVAGLSSALLITEAAEKSGSLHTARFALEQGIDVLAVPGNITSPTSAGTNNLIKSGATPVTCVEDILHVLNIAPQPTVTLTKTVRGSNANEQKIIDAITSGITDASALLNASALSAADFNHHLTMLEISGKLRPLGNNQWSLH